MTRKILTVVLALAVVVSIPAPAYAQGNTTFYPMDCAAECQEAYGSLPGWNNDPMIEHSNDMTFESDVYDEFSLGPGIILNPDMVSLTFNETNGNGYANFSHTGELKTENETQEYTMLSQENIWYTQSGAYYPNRSKTFSIDYKEQMPSDLSSLYQMNFTLGRHTLHFKDYQSDNDPTEVRWIHDQYLSSTVVKDSTINFSDNGWTTVRFSQNTTDSGTFINATLMESDGENITLSSEITSSYVGGTHDFRATMSGNAFEINPDGASFWFDNLDTQYPETNYQVYSAGSFNLHSADSQNNGTGMRMPGFNQSDTWIKDTTGMYEDKANEHDVSDGFTWSFQELYTPTLAHGEGYAYFGVESTAIDNDAIGLRHNFTTATEGGNQSWKISWMRGDNIQETRTLESDYAVWQYSWNQTITTNKTHAVVDIHLLNESLASVKHYQETFAYDHYVTDEDSVRMFLKGQAIYYGQDEHLEMYMINNTFTTSTDLQEPSDGGDTGGDGDVDFGEPSNPNEPTTDLRLEESNLKPDQKTKYHVSYGGDSVTGQANVYSENTSIAVVYQSNNTVQAVNQSVNDSTNIVATYNGSGDKENLYVGYVSTGNLDGGGNESDAGGINDQLQVSPLTAFLTLALDRTMQYIVLTALLGSFIANVTNGFGGLGTIIVLILMGYAVGYIDLGILLATIVMAVFVAINLKNTRQRRI